MSGPLGGVAHLSLILRLETKDRGRGTGALLSRAKSGTIDVASGVAGLDFLKGKPALSSSP